MGKRAGIQLCYPFEERRLLDSKFGWVFPVIIQPKLDGERCRCFTRPVPLLLSSECNHITMLPHIERAVKEQLTGLQDEYDGELYKHGMSFNDIHSIVSRSENPHPDADKMEYHIFEYVGTVPQLQRVNMMPKLKHPLVNVPFVLASSMKEVMYYYDKFIDNGYEGIVIRHPLMPYERKRSRYVMKFKPKKADLYEIVTAVEAISQEGNPKGMVGAFTCRGSDGTLFNVGAGKMPHEERKFWWSNRGELPGQKILIEYQNITPKGVPRFGLTIWPQPFWGKE